MEKKITKTELDECADMIQKCRSEAAKRVVGQTQIVDGILTALIAGGHVLLEGVPGLAKTLAVKTFAEISGLDFQAHSIYSGILWPADVHWHRLSMNRELESFSVRKGPVFCKPWCLLMKSTGLRLKCSRRFLEAMAEKSG